MAALGRLLVSVVVLLLTREALAVGDEPVPGAVPEDIIYVIRHAEKDSSHAQLSRRGWRRAHGIARLWGGGAASRFPPPRSLFANLITHLNCRQTLTPLARHLNLTVNTSYNHLHNKRAAWAIMADFVQRGGPVLVAWEHKNIGALTRHLLPCMEQVIPDYWADDEFDRIFILGYRAAACQSFAVEFEGLNSEAPQILIA